MDKHFAIELVGYVGSVFVVVSLMMSSLVRLRLFSLTGAVVFTGYGLLIGAYPVTALNAFIVGVNGFYLLRMWRAREYFRLLPLQPDSVYLPYFLDFYRQDIARILPDFVHRPAPDRLTLFILRDCNPVGVFIADQRADGGLRVVLDFVVPRYRDLKIGRFLFVDQAEFFRARGVKEIVIAPRTRKFGAYLAEVGFEPSGRHAGALHIRYANRTE